MCMKNDLYFAELPIVKNSQVLQGKRPVLIVSNKTVNQYSSLITVIPLTSRIIENNLPTHVTLEGRGLPVPSVLLAEQIMTIDKKKLLEKVGSIEDGYILLKINRAIAVHLGMETKTESMNFEGETSR